jgi:hypothetical protein
MKSPREQDQYRERIRVQTLAWAQGRPYHEPIEDECCPDFSCCHPELLEPDVTARWAYYHEKHGGLH